MRRRPLNERFGQRVLDGIKTTTIRDSAWTVGEVYMLFHWSGRPYHSPQINVAPVVVDAVLAITINRPASGPMQYSIACLDGLPLWHCEGFDSQADMDRWFSATMEPGQMVEKHLMRFRLMTCADTDRYFQANGKLP